ncbi:hypothetical protein Pcinc_043330, partial [Petrolisthes cinctipes]
GLGPSPGPGLVGLPQGGISRVWIDRDGPSHGRGVMVAKRLAVVTSVRDTGGKPAAKLLLYEYDNRLSLTLGGM